MGRDKALLEVNGKTLLERAIILARTVTENVGIVGSRERFCNIAKLRNCTTAELKVVEDAYPGQGPLAGIHAALSASTAELNLMLGVDTPFIGPRFLHYLVEQAEASGAVVTVPVTAKANRPLINTDQQGSNKTRSGQWSSAKISGEMSGGQAQPLCAVYRREFAAVAEEALRLKRNNIVPLFARVKTREIGESELLQLGFDPTMFENLNTPEEWEAARKKLATDQQG